MSSLAIETTVYGEKPFKTEAVYFLCAKIISFVSCNFDNFRFAMLRIKSSVDANNSKRFC